MSSNGCQNPGPQQSTAVTVDLPDAHNRNIIDQLRSECKTSTGENLQDEEIMRGITENIVLITELAKQGRFTQKQIDQMKQFLAKYSAETLNIAADSVASAEGSEAKNIQLAVVEKEEEYKSEPELCERRLDRLQELFEAYKALSRIEKFFLSRHGPKFALGRALFPLLHKLPKVLHHPQQQPTAAAAAGTHDKQDPEPGIIYIQILHSLVWKSTGMMLYRNDLGPILVLNVTKFRSLARKGILTQPQVDKLERIADGIDKEREAEKLAYAEAQRQASTKEGACVPQPEPAPLMSVLEVYHAVSRLTEFYACHSRPEYAEVRALLRTLRGELQKEVNSALEQTDFNKYLS